MAERRALDLCEQEDLVWQLARKFLRGQCPYCDSRDLDFSYCGEKNLSLDDCTICRSCEEVWDEPE